MRTHILDALITGGLLVPWLGLAQPAIELEATSGTITSPFILTNDCVCQPFPSDAARGGRADYAFTITNAGTYAILARVDAPNSDANSFYVNIDAEPQSATMLWDIPGSLGFINRLVTWRDNGQPSAGLTPRKTFDLSSGEHHLIIRGSTANTRLARLSVVRIPGPPRALRVVAGQ